MRKLRFVYMNNLHEHQTPACYVNSIPLKRVGKNLRWLIYIQMSNNTTLILSIYYQTVFCRTWKRSARVPPYHRVNATIQLKYYWLEYNVIEHRDCRRDRPRQTTRQHVAALARQGGTALLWGSNIFKEGSFT